MEDFKSKVYNAVDGLNLENKYFKYLGIAMAVLSVLGGLFLILTLLGTLGIFALSIGTFGYGPGYGTTGAGLLAGAMLVIAIPILLIQLAAIVVTFKAGMVAKNNWDKPQNSGLVQKWAKYYITFSIIGVVLTLLSGLNGSNLVSILLSLAAMALYFYYSEKLAKGSTSTR